MQMRLAYLVHASVEVVKVVLENQLGRIAILEPARANALQRWLLAHRVKSAQVVLA